MILLTKNKQNKKKLHDIQQENVFTSIYLIDLHSNIINTPFTGTVFWWIIDVVNN